MTSETKALLREAIEKDRLAARVLDTAAGLVEQGWCRFNMARTADGEDCTPQSPRACQWCARGALTAAFARLGLTRRERPYAYYVWDRLHPHGRSGADRARHALNLHIAGGDEMRVAKGCFPSITTWNDEPGRTQRGVVFAFRHAAANLRRRIEIVQDGIREAGG